MSSVFSAAAQPVSLLAMLLSGLLAFVSPCVLPMLPVYAAYLMDGDGGKSSAWVIAKRCLGLVLGFVLLYTVIGAGAGLLGSALKHADRGTLNLVSGALMLLFGLWMMGVIRLNGLPVPAFLSRSSQKMRGFISSFLFGLLMALSFTTCLTPLLANALVLAASADGATAWTGVVSLAIFALGLSLPMVAVMLLYQWLKNALGWLKSRQTLIRRIGGGVMTAYGLYMIVTSL